MSRKFSMLRHIAIIAGSTCLVIAGSAVATPPEPQQPPSEASAETVHYSDQQLQAFSEARREVAKLDAKWQKEAQQAEGEQELAEIQQQANEEMVEAVKEAGLDVETYNAIAIASLTDRKLSKRIEKFK